PESIACGSGRYSCPPSPRVWRGAATVRPDLRVLFHPFRRWSIRDGGHPPPLDCLPKGALRKSGYSPGDGGAACAPTPSSTATSLPLIDPKRCETTRIANCSIDPPI